MGLFVLRGLGWLRVAQFALWGWPLTTELGRYSAVAPVFFVVLALWDLRLFQLGMRAKGMTRRLLVADVAASVAAAVVVGRSYPVGEAASTYNGLIAVLVGTGVTVAVYGSRRGAIGGVGLVIAAWLVGTWRDLGTASASVVWSNAVGILVFAAVTRWNANVLMKAARETDAATDRTVEAQEREAAAEARDKERRRQYSTLHDNVLHTLESIARGVTDIRSQEVRENCERDAEYLRGLITGSVIDVPTDLGAALALMIRLHAASWGSLRVIQQFHALPQIIPKDVSDSIVGVTQEALNNVAKYAQVSEVLVTGYGDGHGGVVLTVADEGVGFDPAGEHVGWGLPWSMRDRVAQIGGTLEIDSARGEGTSVKVTWKP